jgi:hypothetical protein
VSIRPEPVGRLGLGMGLGMRLVLGLAVLLRRLEELLRLTVSLLAILLPLAVLRVAVLLIAVLLLRRLDWYRKRLDWYRKWVVAVMQLRLPVLRHLLELPLLWPSSLSRRRRKLSREAREALLRRGHHWVVWEARPCGRVRDVCLCLRWC